jgi:hypothetical protein
MSIKMPVKLSARRDELAYEHFMKERDADDLAQLSGCIGRIEPRFSGFCYGFDAACAELLPLVRSFELLVEIYEKALVKIEDPRKRDHREPDKYTECACIMNMAADALTEGERIKNDIKN